MARNDFHAALSNALDQALPPEVPQECDLDALVDQCIALLERAGWQFTRTPLVAPRSHTRG
jgi:predicted component of type VI protein secretion system